MTSPLPPKRLHSRDLTAPIRQDRTRLDQLDHGLVKGKFPPARPLKPTGLGDGDEDDIDPPAVLWEENDRLIVTTPGQQTFRLSHVPVDESLMIHWHPDGKGALKQISERWLLNGQTVTILDPGSDIIAGDHFSAQYQYEDAETSDEALILVGYGTAYATNPTITPPAGSQAGDFIVIGTITGTISDSRVSLLADHDGTGLAHMYHYAGTLSNLGDFATTGGTTLATWAVFRAPTISASPAAVVGPGSTMASIPSVSTTHAVIIATDRGGLTDATLSLPAGYTQVVNNGLLVHARQAIGYWDSAAGEASTAAPVTGIFDDYMVNVLGVTNAGVND